MSATPLLLNVFIFQLINGIFFFDLMHCIDHGCKGHKKYAECCNKLLLLYSFTFLLGTIVVTAIVRATTVVATAVSTVAVLVIVVIALDVSIIGYLCIYKDELIEIAKYLNVPYTIMEHSYQSDTYQLIEKSK